MKFMHIADLHLGKKVNEFSMIEQQEYILKQIVETIDTYQVDTVLIAGDIYDRGTPPIEAIVLFDHFLSQIAKRNVNVCMISGNHDSNERLSFVSDLLETNKIYIAPSYAGNLYKIDLEDAFGKLHIYMLPYIKPIHIRKLSNEPITSYQDALQYVMNNSSIDTSNRNILVAHQFVTGSLTCESEELAVGGSENVDGSLFDAFDYVALGHLHRPQKVLRESMRYAGSPLKYSISEANHIKTITLFEYKEKGEIDIQQIPIHPLHDLVEIRSSFETIISSAYSKNICSEDYFHIILEDHYEIVDALAKLREIYPNIMRLTYENIRNVTQQEIDIQTALKSPIELFQDLYELQNNEAMSADKIVYLQTLLEEMDGDTNASD